MSNAPKAETVLSTTVVTPWPAENCAVVIVARTPKGNPAIYEINLDDAGVVCAFDQSTGGPNRSKRQTERAMEAAVHALGKVGRQ